MINQLSRSITPTFDKNSVKKQKLENTEQTAVAAAKKENPVPPAG